MTPHLTHEQLCDIILAQQPHPLSSDFAALDQHLRACSVCAGELASLRSSLKLFREASSAFARHQFAETHARRTSVLPLPRTFSGPLYWIGAAVLTLAALVPLGIRWSHSDTASIDSATAKTGPGAESDEALLEEIDQDLSVSVPSPMRPLADPTAGSAKADSGATPTKN
jgi:hypothetical protein